MSGTGHIVRKRRRTPRTLVNRQSHAVIISNPQAPSLLPLTLASCGARLWVRGLAWGCGRPRSLANCGLLAFGTRRTKARARGRAGQDLALAGLAPDRTNVRAIAQRHCFSCPRGHPTGAVAEERGGSEDVVRKVEQTLPGSRRTFLPVGLGNEVREERVRRDPRAGNRAKTFAVTFFLGQAA